MVAWLTSNLPLVLAIVVGIISEGLSIIQILKYPTNSGVGGILSSILKVLQMIGGANPPAISK